MKIFSPASVGLFFGYESIIIKSCFLIKQSTDQHQNLGTRIKLKIIMMILDLLNWK